MSSDLFDLHRPQPEKALKAGFDAFDKFLE